MTNLGQDLPDRPAFEVRDICNARRTFHEVRNADGDVIQRTTIRCGLFTGHPGPHEAVNRGLVSRHIDWPAGTTNRYPPAPGMIPADTWHDIGRTWLEWAATANHAHVLDLLEPTTHTTEET